ncbi:hypothetical protein LAZ67_20001358 [Cordylochernes scorpioides]|uniref:CCHC-type domain-containing protein n=1 Tax=Cordylochernes scorpioides TaxID=51811 RepID=A0ABY6LPR2_9ARAC|nr:hypothetical protein LAZ67_20001358 [Cordylochernes scorpioides]
MSVGGVGLLEIKTKLQLTCFKGVQTARRVESLNAYSWLVESGAWMAPLSSGSWLLPRRRRLLDLWEQVSFILSLKHRVVPTPALLNLPLVGACRFLATPSLWAPSMRVHDLASPATSLITRLTRSTCDNYAALGTFCRCMVAENARSAYQERSLEEAVVLRGTAAPFLRIGTRSARLMLERPRLAAVPISRYLRRWGPVVDVPSTSLDFYFLRRCSFGGQAADIALRLALHALPHPEHPALSQPVCIACGSSDLSLAHRYWSCSAVRPLIRKAFSIIGRPPDLQSWIFAMGLEDHAITISSMPRLAFMDNFGRIPRNIIKNSQPLLERIRKKMFVWRIPMDHKKRKLSPSTQQARRPQPGTSHQTIAIQNRVAMPPQPPKKHAVIQLKNNKQQQALSKSRSAAATFDQCCFVEWRPDLSPVDYIKALEEKLGKSSVFQIMKMSGQGMVGLITIGNLPIAIRDEDVVVAQRTYCKVVSLNHEVVASGGYTWTTGSREAFVLLNEGLKLHQLPAKLVIISKGESTPAYITYGIECGKCHRKGHRRASCPLKAHESRPAHLQDTRSGPESPSS